MVQSRAATSAFLRIVVRCGGAQHKPAAEDKLCSGLRRIGRVNWQTDNPAKGLRLRLALHSHAATRIHRIDAEVEEASPSDAEHREVEITLLDRR